MVPVEKANRFGESHSGMSLPRKEHTSTTQGVSW